MKIKENNKNVKDLIFLKEFLKNQIFSFFLQEYFEGRN